jgi:hypothetical protein
MSVAHALLAALLLLWRGHAAAEQTPGIVARVVAISGPAWARHTIDNTSRGADGVKLGDLNGDGLPDIVTGWEEGGEVRAYLHPGPENARQAWPRVTVGKTTSVEEAIFADLDGDGRPEVISGAEGKTRVISWHRFRGASSEFLDPSHWSTSVFPATRGLQMWMQAAALDLDGQSGVDLLLAGKGDGASVGWLQAPEQPGDLPAWKFHKLRDAGWIMSLVAQDVDGDGDADVVFSDRKGKHAGVFWLENPGAAANRAQAAWTEHGIGGKGREVMFADVGDVNGDGRMDVAVAVKPADLVLSLRQAKGSWAEQVITLDSARIGRAKAVKIADLNRDGLADLIFTCEGADGEREGAGWLEQQRNGPWLQRPLGGAPGVKFDLIQALDLDGDGDLDVLTCEERDQLGVVWYENPHKSP